MQETQNKEKKKKGVHREQIQVNWQLQGERGIKVFRQMIYISLPFVGYSIMSDK